MSHPLRDWAKLVEDAQSLARVIDTQFQSGKLAEVTTQARFAAMAASLADRLERAVSDAGSGLELLTGAMPRAMIVLRDKADGKTIDVDIGFDPPAEGEPPPACYDAAISFVEWMRKQGTAGGR